MKTLILYYSYTGHTKKLAQARAAETGADLCEILEVRRPGTIAAYTAGSLRAMRGATVPVQPVQANLEDYDRITVMAPVWAGNPAPAAGTVLRTLPPGKEVEVVLVSASGGSKAEPRLRALVEERGCRLTSCENTKG